MILKASERGGAKQLALHLMNSHDNDHVKLHKVYGCMAGDIEGALTEMYAISRSTQCKNFMFSLILSPPKDESPTIEDYEAAVQRIAKQLGLEKQSYILVFHEKAGRRHAHAVFSRIDLETMKAINLPFYKDRLNEIAHELYLAHGWDVPKGFEDRAMSNPLNYGLTEHNESKKAGRDVQNIKSIFQESWWVSDNRQAFEASLREHGFYLCQGTRRGFVLLDTSGNIYSLSRWLGEKTKILKAKLGPPENLLTIEQVKAKIEVTADAEQNRHIDYIPVEYTDKTAPLAKQKQRITERQRDERTLLTQKYAGLRDKEIVSYQKSQRHGAAGLWDRINGVDRRNADILTAKLEALGIQERQEFFELSAHHLQESSTLQSNLDKIKSWAERQYDVSAAQIITQRVRQDPCHVLSLLTDTKSVFSRNDVVRKLHDHIEEPTEFQNVLSKVFASHSLVELHDPNDARSNKVYYSTQEMVDLESGMIHTAEQMAKSKTHGLRKYLVQSAINRQNAELQKYACGCLSDEQRRAIEHITGKEQIAAVIGLAGAGKSTMLSAARESWERQGYRVLGATLAGKAADGLQNSSGIKSRTLASFELSWKNGLHELQKNDVLVIDEAGMVGSRQLARFIAEAQKKGAKLVLVGDPDQLQPINAGAPFRAIADRIGYGELSIIHRQKEEWQRLATYDFAKGNMEKGLQAYHDHGTIRFAENTYDAKIKLVCDYMADWDNAGNISTRLALAHRRADVKSLNSLIREARKQRGDLENEIAFETTHGNRAFATGDRILFTRNDRTLGVKNGTLGIIEKAGEEQLSVNLDVSDESQKSRRIIFSTKTYNDFDHGYATTIHKSQGATVDRTFILASRTMDRNLGYVAMTRHRNSVKLYAGNEDFKNLTVLSRQFSRTREKLSTLDFDEPAELERQAFQNIPQRGYEFSIG